MISLFLYSAIMLAFVLLVERGQKQHKERFFVAERKISGISGAMSIAASWVWAPALFVSTQIGYQYGFSGLFWFTLPNILALCIFAPAAGRIRKVLPKGYSYIEYIKARHPSLRGYSLLYK